MISPWIIFILILFLSYLTGSTPTSIIVGRFTKGIDIREHGSGNAGGTNVFRVLGWKPALVVVIVDVFKGWLPAAIFAPAFYYAQIIPDLGVVQILCGFSAVLGHTYTVLSISICETAGAAETFDLYVDDGDGGTDHYIYKTQALGANETFEHTGRIVLTDEDHLCAATASSANVDVVVSYLDQTR